MAEQPLGQGGASHRRDGLKPVPRHGAEQLVTETKAIAFVDCCGFTTFTSEQGDGAAIDLHLSLRDDLTREARAAGVRS